jgi:hypothetical protein
MSQRLRLADTLAPWRQHDLFAVVTTELSASLLLGRNASEQQRHKFTDFEM